MRGHGLLAPRRLGPPNGDPAHAGTITTTRPDEMWGTDATRFYTEQDGWCWFFGAIDHAVDDIVGWHTAKIGDRWAALEPIRQGVRHAFGAFGKEIARGLRVQTLTAHLSGCLTNPDPTTGLPVITCTEPETIALLLSTMSAHSFNFYAENVGSGVYTVRLNIGATAVASTSSIGANSNVAVGVGVGSLAVQLVQVQTPFNSLCFDLVNGTSCP